ncbi:hypothetical protein ACJZ2D_016515 [Fusarium nematophilum]
MAQDFPQSSQPISDPETANTPDDGNRAVPDGDTLADGSHQPPNDGSVGAEQDEGSMTNGTTDDSNGPSETRRDAEVMGGDLLRRAEAATTNGARGETSGETT